MLSPKGEFQLTAFEKYHRWSRAFELVLMSSVIGVLCAILLLSHNTVMDAERVRMDIGYPLILLSIAMLTLFKRDWSKTNWYIALALGLAVTGPWWSYALGILLAIVWPLLADHPVRLPARLLGVLPVAGVGLAANMLPDTMSGRDVVITACILAAAIVPVLAISWGMREQLKPQLVA